MLNNLKNRIETEVTEQIIRCQKEFSEDYNQLLIKVREQEESKKAKEIFDLMFENEKIAKEEGLPLCQDTGTAVFFVKLGNEFPLNVLDITFILEKSTLEAYKKGYLRKSIVGDPFRRKNTGNNTPAVIHFEHEKGEACEIIFMAKGGGAENKSKLVMLPPTSSEEDCEEFLLRTVIEAGPDACPPFVIGIGIGGNFETAPYLAKKALCRGIQSLHKEEYYRELEKKWLESVNSTGIGAQGKGGIFTALRVFIETAPCHIASLPMAVNMNCHSHRHFKLKYKG